MNKINKFVSGEIKFFSEKYKLQLAILFLAIFSIDVFLIEFINDLMVLFLLSFWIFVFLLYRWQSRFLVVLAMMLLLPAAFFLIFKIPPIAEKFALWAYILFTTAVAQEIWSKIRENG